VRLLAVVAGVYITPIVFLRLGVIPYARRFYILIAMAIIAASVAAVRYSTHALGLAQPALKQILRWSIIPSLILIAGIFQADLPHRLHVTERLPFYLFYVLLSVPAQEFLYRSFLFAELTAARIPRLPAPPGRTRPLWPRHGFGFADPLGERGAKNGRPSDAAAR
jgi:hypothetical protein